MSDFVGKIKRVKDLRKAKGCTFAQIRKAEDELGLKFPEEYKDYVLEFGHIDFGPTEWTGLNVIKRLDTVHATQKARAENDKFPPKCFVLEDWGIEGIKAIVNEEGAVFLWDNDQSEPFRESMSKYLDYCIARDLIDKINTIDRLNEYGHCTDEQIEQAQEELDLEFPEEYTEYVKEFGCISFGAAKWTGLGVTGEQNTVEATQKAKSANRKFPDGYFVLEFLNDGKKAAIVNEDGYVFIMDNGRISYADKYDSISDYLDYCIQRESNKTK
jgi:cell wall assembly regulator SMI1